MSNDNRIFIYIDAQGVVSAREVTRISETEEYIQGICLISNGLRTFRKVRVLEYLDNQANVTERLSHHTANNPEPVTNNGGVIRRRNDRRNDTGRLEVCFTGFKKADKERLIELAESKEFFVRSAVTKNLSFLCCGYNAGPTKIEKSRHQGVVALSESQFLSMLETGEIPEEA